MLPSSPSLRAPPTEVTTAHTPVDTKTDFNRALAIIEEMKAKAREDGGSKGGEESNPT
jgi:hypothetical protein